MGNSEGNNSEATKKVKIEKLKLKEIFGNIKSKYILQKVFNNLEKKKAFILVKYNKNIKNKIDISINDYKEYSETYASIEIEIKNCNNNYDRFININEEDKKYYHIYFDNNKEEIKRNYIEENEKVKIIKIIIDYQVISFRGLFSKLLCF